MIPAPPLPYQPQDPVDYNPGIGLIGCGGITKHHLEAYAAAGYRVVALCDLDRRRAEERQAGFYPRAAVFTDYHELLACPDVAVVDIATHPAERVQVIEDSLAAEKHVLSQKPFVLDLDVGERLCRMADQQGVRLAVNQNGRWAPHFSYLRLAIASGLLGELTSVQFSVNFDHSWVVGTPFDTIQDLVLYDYAIHWFDAVSCFLGADSAERVVASTARAVGQLPAPPMLANAIVDFPGAQVTMSFNGAATVGTEDRSTLVGTAATAISTGPTHREQRLQITTPEGTMAPQLVGSWFPDGFHGTMAELLLSIEEGRAPLHNGRNNLASLALAFAAIGSAHDGMPKRPGEVRRLPGLEEPLT